MLELVSETGQSTAADFLQEVEFFADFFEGWVPFKVAFFV